MEEQRKSENDSVPALRFEGFSDPWEQRKLGECFAFLQNNTLSRAELNGENGAARNLHYGDILVKFDDCLAGESEELPYISDAIITDKYVDSYLRKGDIVFADTAEDEAAGKCIELLKLPDEPVIAGLHTIPARPKLSFGDGFLGHYLNSHSFHDQLLPLMQGIKVIAVSKTTLQNARIAFPSFAEQSCIGALFQKLDSLITLHQRKHEKLKTVKQSLLEKMFPKEGENVPELRFEGFTDPWEQRKLGEISESYSGGTPSAGKEDYYGGDIPFIRSAEIAHESTELHLTQKGLESSSAALVERGCILYALYGATSGEVAISRIKGAINQAILAITPSKNNSAEFIVGWLRREKPRILDTYLQGGQGNLSGAIVKDLPLSLPSGDEQSCIGALFQKLDSLITLHQRELEILKNLKKALLEKMFV